MYKFLMKPQHIVEPIMKSGKAAGYMPWKKTCHLFIQQEKMKAKNCKILFNTLISIFLKNACYVYAEN